jgi:hypothetical protein
MTFDEILEQVITLLKRQGRVSYGAIKRRFELDDDYLKDIKIELIEAQRLAADENGRILVWSGETEGKLGYPFNAGQLEDGHRDSKCRKARPGRLRLQKPEALMLQSVPS